MTNVVQAGKPSKGDMERQRAQAMALLVGSLSAGGRSRKWMAGIIGIPRQRWWTYEHGLSRVPEDVLVRACQIVGVSPEMLYTIAPPGLLTRPAEERRGRPPKSPSTPLSTRSSADRGAPVSGTAVSPVPVARPRSASPATPAPTPGTTPSAAKPKRKRAS